MGIKYFCSLMLFLWVVSPISSINNRIYFNAVYGVVYQPITDPYKLGQVNYLGANIGWHGVFANNREDFWESGFGVYNVGVFSEIGYYQKVEGEALGSLKISGGLSLGQYFVFYVKPNFFYHLTDNALGLSSSIGLKINTFINDVALGFGIGVDIPIPLLGNGMYPESSLGLYASFDVIYEINRTKKRTKP